MHALFLNDDETVKKDLADLLASEGFTTAVASSASEARRRLAERRPDVVLLNTVPGNGEVPEFVSEIASEIPCEVILAGGPGVRSARLDMIECLHRPGDLGSLKTLLGRIRQGSGDRLSSPLEAESETCGRQFGRMLGNSKAMQLVYMQLSRVARTSATVFITGESGTGKELAAHMLHDLSARAAQPFVAVNCGAISPQLIESELFGHEKGSFTGAVRDHKGYFERAAGGTLFLDEVTEMPLDLQVKLLRVLEAHTLVRVGAIRETEVDVRLIAATNRSPEEAVAEGKLREDLLYRLQVFPLALPPLRARSGDVELLANAYLDELNRSEGCAKKLSADALQLLNAYHWPGNVRELKNLIQRAFILADGAITPDHFPLLTRTESNSNGPYLQIRIGTTVGEVERRLILATLEQCQGAKEKAAEILGISLKTLYNRLHEYESECDVLPFVSNPGNIDRRRPIRAQ